MNDMYDGQKISGEDGKRVIIELSVGINHFETPIRFSERVTINLSYLYAIYLHH
jgi:hypothetical protein